MKHRNTLLWTALLLVTNLALGGAACSRKKPATGLPPAPAPAVGTTRVDRPVPTIAPTVTLTAEPSTIRAGETTRLTWTSTNAESLTIDGGVGSVAEGGSVQVSPLQSTTYTATATNLMGTSKASARVTIAADTGTPAAPVASVDQSSLNDLTEMIRRGDIQDVFFHYDQSALGEEAKRIVEKNAQALRRTGTARVIIEGHCDDRGTDDYNLALGDRRANSVREYLVSLGIAAARLETISYGEERPFATGQDEASYAQNRRAHFRPAN
ncbi:MAG: peptidoglycan-associated lipoprotein Pal [Acidobacteriota bacterium]